jgi:thiol-disulfide isomerase/thioredoxin
MLGEGMRKVAAWLLVLVLIPSGPGNARGDGHAPHSVPAAGAGTADRARAGAHPATSKAAVMTGVCLVCKVKHGEAEAEPVKATRTHDGQSYGFCSEKCAGEFAADPLAFLPPVFPRTASGFALTDLAGGAVTAESLRGRVVLLDFWATWCAPCRRSMPALQALHERYAARGLTVLGVSIDENSDAKVRKFVKDKAFTYAIAIDSAHEPAWLAYRVKSVPAAFLIDRDGNVVAQWTGAAAPEDELEARVRELLGVR